VSTDVRVTESSTPALKLPSKAPCVICGDVVVHGKVDRIDFRTEWATHEACWDPEGVLYE
jgi:hypothetical protein